MSEHSHDADIAEIWQLFRETDARLDQRMQETDARLDRRMQETQARIDATAASLQRLEGLFTSQWGKMLEALVEPAALNLFRARGIDVHRIYQRSSSQLNGESMEIDLILEDDTDLVVVEVKSTLKIDDVREFLADLDEFPRFFPRYRNMTIFGAVAGMQIDENADRYAYRQGLFVLAMGGDGFFTIRNDAKFRPRNFGPAAR